MKFEKGTSYHGFFLKQNKKVASIASDVFLFEHKKTGAQLLYIKNKDPEIFYALGFRTPPYNDTGLNHILEHALLMGSEKYPIRDPFIHLLKTSHVASLNAYTSPDKTYYPISTTNKLEFKKLISVYTDAVFRPKILTDKRIFMQEGVRHELQDNGELTANGVVFNEMKASLSTPESILMHAAFRTLYPDTSYRFESGGHPESIIALTHEELVAYHKKYYHPSNAHIYFYGDVPLVEHLKFLDEEYLSSYTRKKPDSVIALQPAFEKPKRFSKTYFAPDSDDEYYQYSFVLNAKDNLEINKYVILANLLVGSPTAPLRKALMDSGLVASVTYEVADWVRQPFFMIAISRAKKGSEKQVKKIITDTLKDIAERGFSKVEIYANIQKVIRDKFAWNEVSERGLELYRLAEMSWLFDQDPIKRLDFLEGIDTLHKTVTNKWLTKAIKEKLIDNPHRTEYTLLPTKIDTRKEYIDTFLEKKKNKLTSQQKELLVQEKKEFDAWQKSADDPTKYLTAIDVKTLSDVSPYTALIQQTKKNGLTAYFAKKPQGLLSGVELHFDIKHLTIQEIKELRLFTLCLGYMPTSNYTLEEFTLLKKQYLSNVFSSIDVGVTESKKTTIFLRFGARFLDKDEVIAQKLIHEYVYNMLTDEEQLFKRIKEITSSFQEEFSDPFMHYPDTRMRAMFTEDGRINEEISGYEFYAFIKEINSIEKVAEFAKQASRVYHKATQSNNILLSLFHGKSSIEQWAKQITLTKKKQKIHTYKPLARESTLFVTPASNNANVLGFMLGEVQNKSAERNIFSRYTTLNYLWKKIREQGGAYGSRASVTATGVGVLSSFADPRIDETFKDFMNVKKYLQTPITHEDLNASKVASFARLDTPRDAYTVFRDEVVKRIHGTTAVKESKNRKKLKTLSTKEFQEFGAQIGTSLAQSVRVSAIRKDKKTAVAKHYKRIIEV